jgi:hypothetical protein
VCTRAGEGEKRDSLARVADARCRAEACTFVLRGPGHSRRDCDCTEGRGSAAACWLGFGGGLSWEPTQELQKQVDEILQEDFDDDVMREELPESVGLDFDLAQNACQASAVADTQQENERGDSDLEPLDEPAVGHLHNSDVGEDAASDRDRQVSEWARRFVDTCQAAEQASSRCNPLVKGLSLLLFRTSLEEGTAGE